MIAFNLVVADGSDWLLLARQAERQSLRLQLERLESELHSSHEQNSQLTGRLHKAEREVSSLTCQVRSSQTYLHARCEPWE